VITFIQLETVPIPPENVSAGKNLHHRIVILAITDTSAILIAGPVNVTYRAQTVIIAKPRKVIVLANRTTLVTIAISALRDIIISRNAYVSES